MKRSCSHSSLLILFLDSSTIPPSLLYPSLRPSSLPPLHFQLFPLTPPFSLSLSLTFDSPPEELSVSVR